MRVGFIILGKKENDNICSRKSHVFLSLSQFKRFMLKSPKRIASFFSKEILFKSGSK